MDMDGHTNCQACGASTPKENLNCIYCGEILPLPVGVLSGLKYSYKGWLAAVIALVTIIAFLLLIL